MQQLPPPQFPQTVKGATLPATLTAATASTAGSNAVQRVALDINVTQQPRQRPRFQQQQFNNQQLQQQQHWQQQSLYQGGGKKHEREKRGTGGNTQGSGY
jgi:hypothetical protein